MRLKHLVGGRVSRRRIGRVGLIMVLVATLIPARSVAASNSTMTSDQVAAEILRMQTKADKTAKRWSEAQIRQQDVAAQIETSQAKIAAASAQYADLQAGLERIAIDRYTGGAAPSILLVAGDLTETLQVNVLKNIALDAGAADLDTLDAARSDLQRAAGRPRRAEGPGHQAGRRPRSTPVGDRRATRRPCQASRTTQEPGSQASVRRASRQATTGRRRRRPPTEMRRQQPTGRPSSQPIRQPAHRSRHEEVG